MSLEGALRAALDGKAKPLGSLGRIEDLAVRLGVIQGVVRPSVRRPVVLVFAGDHGAVGSGVSAYPSAVTGAMVGLYLEGRAAINVFAGQAGAEVVVVDAGVAADLGVVALKAGAGAGLVAAKVGMGTRDWSLGAAMTGGEVGLALERGGAAVDGLVDGGTNVIGLGEMGIGNTASAALLVHKVAGLPLVVGAGAGLDEAGLAGKRAVVARGSARTGARLGAVEALGEYGGFEIAMLVGAILRGAELGVCLVVDGVIVTAAAVVAEVMRPGCLEACVFAHRSAEPGHDAMLGYLGARPLLDLGLRLGEGTGAALAIPLLRAACGVLEQMADLADVV